ncbi:hypothetical protein VTK56DRAFT_8786 [Thermocarpiscus australiensis]
MMETHKNNFPCLNTARVGAAAAPSQPAEKPHRGSKSVGPHRIDKAPARYYSTTGEVRQATLLMPHCCAARQLPAFRSRTTVASCALPRAGRGFGRTAEGKIPEESQDAKVLHGGGTRPRESSGFESGWHGRLRCQVYVLCTPSKGLEGGNREAQHLGPRVRPSRETIGQPAPRLSRLTAASFSEAIRQGIRTATGRLVKRRRCRLHVRNTNR